MQFIPTSLEGILLITPELKRDPRGAFARIVDEDSFAAAGLPTQWPQQNLSWTEHRATLRGMHFQSAPKAEAKLVRCIRGRVFDVAVDLRADSPSFARWFAIELSAENRSALFIPEGFAHGFITLCDDCEMLYMMSACYDPAAARGCRWDDPLFSISWPFPPQTMAERDASWPDFAP